MKKLICALLALCAMCAMRAMAVTYPPADLYTKAYVHGMDTTPGARALWDACPAVALIACPNADATNWVSTYAYTGSVYYAAASTNYQNSAYQPLSWDTTTWPWANTNGIPYGVIIITNPPTKTVLDIKRGSGVGDVKTVIATVTTNDTGGVTAYTTATVTNALAGTVTTNTYTFSLSNVWVNISGTSNGWKMVQ